MRPDPKIDCARAPVVVLGGLEFFVPTLALRQARMVVPGLLKLMPRLNAIQGAHRGRRSAGRDPAR